MSTIPQYILEQIQIAKTEKHKRLSLYTRSDQELTQIPEEVFELDHLNKLSLRHHSITTIPDQIKQLKQLKILDLRGNPLEKITDTNGLILDFETYQRLKTNLAPKQISGLRVKLDDGDDLPPDLFELPNLTVLDLSGNELSNLPKSIKHLQQLTELDLSWNQLSNLPESITQLQQLTILDLGDNQLRKLPESIANLRKLTKFNLENNQLSKLPDSIRDLTQLTRLNLGDNQLSELPESIIHLRDLTVLGLNDNKLSSMPESITRLNKLKWLDIGNYGIENQYQSKNTLTTVPESIIHLPQLKTLDLYGNPLESPPIEIAEQGIEEIKEYFRQVQEEGIDYLYEAKLLILGEGGAGKTTLAKKIENRKYKLQKEEKSTEGIDVMTWHFPLENGRKFRVNIWDFGGQEIYHTTHQFFLTKRSLYALVADMREENTDFYYWLNAVELLAEDSPLLIIKNEKQKRRQEINERQLRADFDNLKQTLATNLATNRGLDEILETIRYYIRNLPHVGSPLPKTWVKVRDALEQDDRDYVTQTEYLALCETNGFKQHKDKLQLSGYLHDLGVCLHFQDDPVLRNTVIIKPEWATDAVYRVLDNKKVIKQQGKFSQTELDNIWHEHKYAPMRHELLQLMLKFKLCYKIKHSDWYIAPQLLTLNKPSYPWNGHQNLRMRYQYDFMPKGIMTRFIVAVHDLIWQQPYVWRSGVILQDKETNTKAEVIEHYNKREIKIRVEGEQPKELMRIVCHELEQIHESFKRLKYQKWVPCNCAICLGEQIPHFYSFKILLKFRRDGREIQCQNSYEMMNVRQLIDDAGSMISEKRWREGDIEPHHALMSEPAPVEPSPKRQEKVDSQAEVSDEKVDSQDQALNKEAGSQDEMSEEKTQPKNWEEYLRELLFFGFIAFFLGLLSAIFTIYDLPLFQKDVLRAGISIISLISALFALLWKRDQRASRIRWAEFSLLILMTGGLAWFTFQPYAGNSCPSVELSILDRQIKVGETVELIVKAKDPENDALNYTWEATLSGLKREDGPYETLQNDYTAPADAAGERVTITVHVDDNQCGERVSDAVTIPILLEN